MPLNFGPRSSFSSVGLGPGNENINDFPMFHSSSDDHSSSSLNHMIWDGATGLNSDSNLGNSQLGSSLFSHRVTEVTRTLVRQQLFHSAIEHISFPLSDQITVSREVVETTCFVASSSSIMDRIFAHSHSVRNQAIFPSSGFSIQAQQPAAVRNQDNQMVPFLSESSTPSKNQVMNPFLTESPSSLMTQEAFSYVSNPAMVPGNQNRETVFNAMAVYPSEQPTSNPMAPLTVNLQTPDDNLNNFNYNMNKPIRQVRIVELSHDENVSDHANIVSGNANRETVFDDAHALACPAEQASIDLENLNNSNYNVNESHVKPIRQVKIVELSDDENNAAAIEYPLGNDGRIHSLPNPDGTYGCPICFASCDSAQSFGSHVQLHYQNESVEEKNRRMAAKCRHKRLRLVKTSQGVTAVPAHHGLSSMGRKKKGKEKIDVINSENLGLIEPFNSPSGAAAKKRPLGVVIKEEAISSSPV